MFSIEKRFREHLAEAKKKRQEHRPLYAAIRKYGEEHFSIRVLEEVPAEQASEAESKWIARLDTFHKGYNATLGGDGKSYVDRRRVLSLYDDSSSYTQKEIAILAGCCQDTVKAIVAEAYGKVDWQKRQVDSGKSKGLNPGKPVRCIETNIIFPSATQAANWLLSEGKISSQKYGRNKIPEVCRGQRKTIGGFHWEYAE